MSARCHKTNTEIIRMEDFMRAPRRTPSSGECALTGPLGSFYGELFSVWQVLVRKGNISVSR